MTSSGRKRPLRFSQRHYSGIVKLPVVMTTLSLNILILSTFHFYYQYINVYVISGCSTKNCGMVNEGSRESLLDVQVF